MKREIKEQDLNIDALGRTHDHSSWAPFHMSALELVSKAMIGDLTPQNVGEALNNMLFLVWSGSGIAFGSRELATM